MKKKFLSLMVLSALTFAFGACTPTTSSSSSPSSSADSSSSQPLPTYTVGFNVDGERYKTVMVKEGQKIEEEIPNPSKENFRFTGWYEGSTLVDLETYVVVKNTTFDAAFEAVEPDDVLSVDDVKEAGKDYYMVLGWWEVNDPNEPDKVTSGLTKDSVRLFYANLIKYLTAKGATAADIDNISFRNYSSAVVADMGAMVNEDADVDILIGVGANVFTTAGVKPYNTSEDSKFQTTMGVANKSRYVALVENASTLAKETYDWLDTEVGHKTFLEDVSQEEINGSLGGDVINLTVNVHGDTVATTVLDDKDDIVTMPTITVAEGYQFDGFSTTENGEVVLAVAKDAKLKWADLKDLAGDATTLDLYPVITLVPVATADLVVYVQVNSSYLTDAEAWLLYDRYVASLEEEMVIDYVVVEGDAATFKSAVESADVDVVVGGNNPIKNFDLLGELHDVEGTLTPTNTGAKHFANASRKVGVLNNDDADRLEAAKDFYNFVINEAPVYDIHTTFWGKGGDWVTAEEVTTIKAGIELHVETLLGLEEDETLLDMYNVTFSYYEATNTAVADLGAETNALNDGEGTDLLVGCGANVTTKGLVEVVEKKVVDASQIAANRYVALVKEKTLVRSIYENYFIEATAA